MTRTRRVRLGDVTPRGRLRLDATARYLQDVANDDATDSVLDRPMDWVVRRCVIEVTKPAVFNEDIELTTFCSGTGGRWAERRTSVVGNHGASIEAAALWVYVDIDTGRPKRLPPEFEEVWGSAAAGRKVRARLLHTDRPPPSTTADPSWPLRFCDLDLLGHLNNAVYWVAVEEQLQRRRELRWPLRAEIEHRAGVLLDDVVRWVVADGDDGSVTGWLVRGDEEVVASLLVRPLPAQYSASR